MTHPTPSAASGEQSNSTPKPNSVVRGNMAHLNGKESKPQKDQKAGSSAQFNGASLLAQDVGGQVAGEVIVEGLVLATDMAIRGGAGLAQALSEDGATDRILPASEGAGFGSDTFETGGGFGGESFVTPSTSNIAQDLTSVDVISNAWQTVAESAGTVGENAGQALSAAGEALGSVAGSAAEMAGDAAGAVLEATVDIVGGILGGLS